MGYAERFKEFFGLSKEQSTIYDGDVWVRLHISPFGAVLLQRGLRYEGMTDQMGWYDNKLILVDGCSYSLAALLFLAERIGLPTDQPDPYLDRLRQAEEYQEMLRTGQLILE